MLREFVGTEMLTCIAPILEQILNDASTDYDLYLETRDSSEFDKSWSDEYKKLEIIKKSLKKKDRDALNIFSEEVRKSVFMMVIRKTGSGDLAAAISDDIGLIFEALNFANPVPWIWGMWDCYCNKILPSGKIEFGKKPPFLISNPF